MEKRNAVYLCSLLLWSSSCLEPHHIVDPQQQEAPLIAAEQRFSHKDVRDIFDRHNCVVCHRHSKQLDLRLFPFVAKGVPLEPLSDQISLEKIIQYATENHIPAVSSKTLTEEEKNRLFHWQKNGYLGDESSPLLGLPSEK
jgi:uncharacterized membrane protein